MRLFSKTLRLLLLFLITIHYAKAQDVNPEQYFGDSYSEALKFLNVNRNSFEKCFAKYGVDANEAFAVVFPEIIRFNRFSDFIETSALELTYVRGGSAFADFSIGHFQMKPSFIESIEQNLQLDSTLKVEFKDIYGYPNNLSESEIRNCRLDRLKQESWQLKYLSCFIRLAEKRFAKELMQNPNRRLLILSSSYNLGLNSTYVELKSLSERKTFPYGKMHLGRFSYYDVSSYFFKHNSTNQTLISYE